MPNLKTINQEILESTSIELVTESLGQVAAIRFKGNKDQIQHNSLFFNEVIKVYRAVQMVATKHRLEQHLKGSKNGKTISVLLTSNAHFNGGLDREVAAAFISQTSRYQGDRVVIGSSGIGYLNEMGTNNFQSVRLKNDNPSNEELVGLVNSVKDFSRILVYYSKFITVLDQRPDIVDLAEPEVKAAELPQSLEYILEPELKEMLEFFEGQILAALLDSLFLQANLARTASRMVSMDQAQQNAKREVEKEKHAKLKIQKFIKNLSALENYVSEITIGI